jgi:hypothetical protein
MSYPPFQFNPLQAQTSPNQILPQQQMGQQAYNYTHFQMPMHGQPSVMYQQPNHGLNRRMPPFGSQMDGSVVNHSFSNQGAINQSPNKLSGRDLKAFSVTKKAPFSQVSALNKRNGKK